jgi:hypothetical protein
MKKALVIASAMLLVAGGAIAGDRNLEGSYVELVDPDPAVFCPCETYTLTFYVWNNSTDAEWIDLVEFMLPDCWEVDPESGGYDDSGASNTWSFAFQASGNLCAFIDSDGGYGEIYGQEGGYFWFDVHVCPDAIGEVPIDWHLSGDEWGDPPHEVYGTIYVEVSQGSPTEHTTWGQVKGLYR